MQPTRVVCFLNFLLFCFYSDAVATHEPEVLCSHFFIFLFSKLLVSVSQGHPNKSDFMCANLHHRRGQAIKRW